MDIKTKKKIIIPVNITHNGDMDGEGCAFLSKYIFNDSRMRNMKEDYLLPTTYTRCPDEEIDASLGYFRSDRKWHKKLEKKKGELASLYLNEPELYQKKLDQYINRISRPSKSDTYDGGLVAEHDQIAFTKAIIIGIPNTFDMKVLNDEIVEKVLDKIKNIKKDITDYKKKDTIEVLYIITDIYVSEDNLLDTHKTIIAASNKVTGMKYWMFDHHVSNPQYHMSSISSNADVIVRNRPWGDIADSAYIADYAVICEGYHLDHNYYNIHPYTITHGFKAMKPMIEYCEELDMFESCLFWKRSATFHYFMFLLKAGFFSLDDSEDDLIHLTAVTWIVYIISMYDTFEFDVKDLPVSISLPDALTILFKHFGKFGVMTDMLKDFVESEVYQRNSIVAFNADENDNDSKYLDLPLPVDVIDRLVDMVHTRENKFMRELYSAKTVTKAHLRNVFDTCSEESYKSVVEILDAYPEDLKIALFAGAVDDASYAGNTCCKKYGFDLAIMLYNEKRILSLRSNNKQELPFDCVTLAKALGGGGHLCAAGCSVDPNLYVKLLYLFWNHGKSMKEYLEGIDYEV